MIDVKEVVCGDPACSPIDTLVTIGKNFIPTDIYNVSYCCGEEKIVLLSQNLQILNVL